EGCRCMSYTLTIDSKGRYLHAVVHGANDRATVLSYFAEIREACVQRDCYRVLVEEHLEGPRFPPEVLLPLMAEVAGMAGATFEALAYVDVMAVTDMVLRLASQVVEPGAAVGVFDTVAEAEAWIGAWNRPT
ncbi:MAG TPA: hypothetical protein VG940_05185, partial [Gemmatimonadales bacterium]|nr:hypothetical protein [Gemmatimonadales bacterium]